MTGTLAGTLEAPVMRHSSTDTLVSVEAPTEGEGAGTVAVAATVTEPPARTEAGSRVGIGTGGVLRACVPEAVVASDVAFLEAMGSLYIVEPEPNPQEQSCVALVAQQSQARKFVNDRLEQGLCRAGSVRRVSAQTVQMFLSGVGRLTMAVPLRHEDRHVNVANALLGRTAALCRSDRRRHPPDKASVKSLVPAQGTDSIGCRVLVQPGVVRCCGNNLGRSL